MRELDERVAAAARPLLAGAVLLVGARSEHAITSLERPEQDAAVHDSALWLAPSDALLVRTGLAALRGKLKPGAPLVLAVRKQPPLLQRLLGSSAGPPIELATLCGVLLTSGLLLPRVHPGPTAYHLLSASLPRASDALDEFFTQPPTR